VKSSDNIDQKVARATIFRCISGLVVLDNELIIGLVVLDNELIMMWILLPAAPPKICRRHRRHERHLIADAYSNHVARDALTRSDSGIETRSYNIDGLSVDGNVVLDLGILRQPICYVSFAQSLDVTMRLRSDDHTASLLTSLDLVRSADEAPSSDSP
jgi:hypothetical protein